MTDSTASELVYELEQSKKELETQPSVEESLAKLSSLFEIQTMLKVSEQIRATAKASIDRGFREKAWNVAEEMAKRALNKMNKILEQEENHGKKN